VFPLALKDVRLTLAEVDALSDHLISGVARVFGQLSRGSPRRKPDWDRKLSVQASSSGQGATERAIE
jgi:hypothetical protein